MGDFAFVAEPATIGGNRGNRFTVTLRGLKASNSEDTETTLKERLERIVKSLRSVGYVNYYGLQRFGNGGLNVEVGACMLRSEWKEAVMGILNSNHSNGNVMQKAIKVWEETKSGAEAAKVLPKFMHSEAQLFRALDKSGGKGFSVGVREGVQCRTHWRRCRSTDARCTFTRCSRCCSTGSHRIASPWACNRFPATSSAVVVERG